MKELFEIFCYRLLWLNIILVIILAMLMFHYHFLSLFSFVALINLYDILGYHFTLIRRSTQLPDKIIIRAYRVHQLLFEILIILFIAFVIDWKYAVSCSVIKWFGLQDILYYLTLKKEIPERFTLMKWTPFGILKGDLSKNEVIFQAIVGIIISVLISILS